MPASRANLAGFERTVKVLRAVGRIEPQHAALIAFGRTLARQIDAGDTAGQFGWQYMNVVRMLIGEVAPAGPNDDDLAAFLAVLSAQMGDAAQP